MKKLFPLLSILFILLVFMSCSQKAWVKWKYRKDYWVKTETTPNPIQAKLKQIKKEKYKDYNASLRNRRFNEDAQSEGVISVPRAFSLKKERNTIRVSEKYSPKRVLDTLPQQAISNPVRRRPIFGVLSLSTGGASIFLGIWGGIFPPFAVIWALFFLGAVGMGITSLVLHEDKKGLAIGGLAAALLSIFVLVVWYFLVGYTFFPL